MQFGPTSRMPAWRTRPTSSASRAWPSAPISLKPALMTTTALTSFAMQSSITGSTPSAGTRNHGQVERARNVGHGCDTPGRRRSTRPTDARRTAVPVKPPAIRLCRSSDPILPRSRLAPIDDDAAWREDGGHRRGGGHDGARGGDGRVSSRCLRATAPRDRRRCRGRRSITNPESSKTRIMRVLSPRTSASKNLISCRRPISASRSSNRVPTPRPLQRVGDGKRDVGAMRHPPIARIAGHREDAAAGFTDEHDIVGRISGLQSCDFGVIAPSHRKESKVLAFARQLLVKSTQFLVVVGARFAQEERRSVAEDHVRLIRVRKGCRHRSPTRARGVPGARSICIVCLRRLLNLHIWQGPETLVAVAPQGLLGLHKITGTTGATGTTGSRNELRQSSFLSKRGRFEPRRV